MTEAVTKRQKERPADSAPLESSPLDSSSLHSALLRSSDERLIADCLKGDQEAWGTLIDKYKNLIYSIPVKLGMHQDAGDI